MKRVDVKLNCLESDVGELQWRPMNNNIIVSRIKVETEEDQESAVTKNHINYKL